MVNKILCPFCNEEISSLEATCPYCAETLQNETAKNEDEIPTSRQMDPDDIKKLSVNQRLANQFKNHLEFLGFSIDEIEGDGTSTHVMLISKHEKRSNLLINVINEDAILVSARYTISKVETAEKLSQIYENLNKANANALASRWSYSQDSDGDCIITIELFFRKYDKVEFWKNLELMEDEVHAHLQLFADE